MPNFQPRATSFSAVNAQLLARLCNAAYLDQVPARDATLQLGLPGFIWIDLTQHFEDLFAIAAGGNGFVVIAFRGTQNFDDWMDDLRATPVSFPWMFDGGPEVGAIHAGFGHAVRDAWTQIQDSFGNLIPTPDVAPGITEQPTVWLTGHSLGGALAIIAGAACSMWSAAPIRSIAGIYTFGQPRVGLYDFCGNFDHLLKQRTFRFVNKQDLVPRVPFRGFDYADLGQMIHFDNNGTPRLESAEWRNFLGRTLQSFDDFFNIAGHAQTDVADHSMAGYQQLVDGHVADLQALFK
jgi:triacylglycerol lipase